MTPLTKTIVECQQSDSDWTTAAGAVSELVYSYTLGKAGFGTEDSAEFLLFFYPRIRKLIERYRPAGSSFEAYLHTTLRWQLRSFALQRGNEKIRLRTAESTGAVEMAHLGSVNAFREAIAATGPVVRDEVKLDKPGAARRVPDRNTKLALRPRVDAADGGLSSAEAQRVLLLALKGSDHMDRGDCLRLAAELGVDPTWLLGIWSELRLCCTEKRERKERVRRRRDYAWFTLRFLEMQDLHYSSEAIQQAHERKKRYWQRAYENARERLHHISVTPTHQEIADALGIPKGTVDSGIFLARQEVNDKRFVDRLARVFDST